MLLKNFLGKRQPRKFSFTPFYYDVEADQEPEAGGGPRIKFRRLRKAAVKRKPVRGLLVLAILVAFSLFYFWGTLREKNRRFEIKDIRIGETP